MEGSQKKIRHRSLAQPVKKAATEDHEDDESHQPETV